jgi:hypothetical protein
VIVKVVSYPNLSIGCFSRGMYTNSLCNVFDCKYQKKMPTRLIFTKKSAMAILKIEHIYS